MRFVTYLSLRIGADYLLRLFAELQRTDPTGCFTASAIATACHSATDCTRCMMAHPTCNWCIAKRTTVSTLTANV